MPLPTPTSKSHFTVPSSERCSERIAGVRTSAMAFSFSRNDFARSVIAPKSSMPRWWIHWNTWRARNGFSPCAANGRASAGGVNPRGLVRPHSARLVARPFPAVHLALRKEKGDLGGRRFRRIGAVHRVRVDRLREVGADGALV